MIKATLRLFRAGLCVVLTVCGGYAALAQPAGFQLQTIWSGFTQITAVRFAPDGRVFVAEKAGVIKAFDNIADTTPTVVANFTDRVWSYHDHGMLGLAVDPQFPTRPYIYVLYSLRGVPGGHLSRLTINPATNQMTGAELILIEDWAQVYPSHSIGDLHFGPDGALYATAGDGANFWFADWGQNEPNDPDGQGGIDAPDPVNEGGALRSQDIRTMSDPLGLNGTLIRIDPDTGEAKSDNPLSGGNPADDRVIAYGLRNPFRFTIHPTTNDIWIGDVGWNDWEEINRVPYPFTTPIRNFGWPAYEGVDRQGAYDSANLPLLETLYAENSAVSPYYSYQHNGGASITAASFYVSGDYPAQYQGALFFADYTMGKIWVMYPDANGLPNTSNIQTFIASGAAVVDLQRGPGGDLYYADIVTNQVRRIDYLQGNAAPVAILQASATAGAAPLQVAFSAATSYDPDPGTTLSYAWDLDGDGAFDDATSIAPVYTYTQGGNYTVALRVTDNLGAFDTDSVVISVDNLPPVASILSPLPGTLWQVGELISFAGEATDPETGVLAESQLSWEVILWHCADLEFTDCHEHHIMDVAGTATGQFISEDHEYPCYIEIRLTATEPDPNGLSSTTSVVLTPQVTTLTLESNPPGLQVSAFSDVGPAPFVKDILVNGQTTVSAVSPQTFNGLQYVFATWSDGGAQSHGITAGTSPITLTANFVLQDGEHLPPSIDPIWDREVTAGNLIDFYIHASDPEGTIPTLSATNLPIGATLTDQGNGSAYFQWATQPGDAGDYTITVTAVDGGSPPLSNTEVFTVHVLSGNKPPSMDGVWDTVVNAGELIDLRIGAWDTDGDIPELRAENLPPGATYDEMGWWDAHFIWQTTAADAGVYTGIRIVATDHGQPPMSNERVFAITVRGQPNGPTIDPVPPQNVLAGDTLTFVTYSVDPDGTIPNLSASNLPSGATFSSNGDGTGTFTWPTTADDAGLYEGVTIVATDSATPSLTYKAFFKINVIANGTAPVLSPIGPRSVEEGELLQFSVTANDPDDAAPDLGVDVLPFGASFIDNGNGTGTFTWTPAVGAATNSPYFVTFEASDGSFTDTETVEISVTEANEAPHLETIGNREVNEEELLTFVVSAHDHNGTIPALSAANLPAGASFVDNGDGTGEFAWTPQPGAAIGSPYLVTFYASDGELVSSETIAVTVLAGNQAPVVSTVGSATIAENESWSTIVNATDPDGTIPMLSASGLPTGASFIDHGDGSGTLQWTPDFTASAASPYLVMVTASDGSLSDSETVILTVTNSNRPPELQSIGDRSVDEGQLLQFAVSATDADGDAITLSAQGLPAGATFTDTGNGTGLFSWTPDFAASALSPYAVTVAADDGAANDTEQVTITVSNVNRAPLLDAIGNKSVNEGELLQFNVAATDPDGQIAALSAQNIPSGATFVDNGNGTGTFSWTPSSFASGTYSVTFGASDGQATDSETIVITVVDVPSNDTITVLWPNGGETWQYKSYVNIAWSSTGNIGGSVRIDLLRNGSLVRTLTTGTPNDGRFTYRVQQFLASGGGYRVRVVSVMQPQITDDSDGTFNVSQ